MRSFEKFGSKVRIGHRNFDWFRKVGNIKIAQEESEKVEGNGGTEDEKAIQSKSNYPDYESLITVLTHSASTPAKLVCIFQKCIIQLD